MLRRREDARPFADAAARPCGRRRLLRVPGFVISEFLLPAGYESGEHAHVPAGLVVPLSGGVTLSHSSTSRLVLPGHALTLPPGIAHREYASTSANCLLLEAAPESLSELPRLFDGMWVMRDGQMERAAARLAGLLESDARAGWELEYEAVELMLLAWRAGAPVQNAKRRSASWISLVADRLRSEFSSPPSCSDLAREAGISREHLVREFRRVTGETVGTFLRRHRVLEAARLLRESERPISRIATAAGFVDQSHLTRQLRRYLGVTPGMLRTPTGSRAARKSGRSRPAAPAARPGARFTPG